MNITVIGAGYVGLVITSVFASLGHKIICIDVDKEKIDSLCKSKDVIYEPFITDYLKRYKKNIIFTTDGEIAYKNRDIIFVCVNTPSNNSGECNLNYVRSAFENITNSINNDALIVIKSTVPVGTTKDMKDFINGKSLNNNVAFNPEFLSQGTALNDFLFPNRIVLGINHEKDEIILRELYKDFKTLNFLVTDSSSAEMIKYVSNSYLAMKLSYINEIANLCEDLHTNIDDVLKGVGMDERIGSKYMNPGIGFGGSCFPKDVDSLITIAKENNYRLEILDSVKNVNQKQKMRLIEKTMKYYTDIKGLNIAVLGLAFKPNTDDLRDAPALNIIKSLITLGANVIAWDPVSINKCKQIFPDISYVNSIDEAITNTDVCYICTEWDEIKKYTISNFERKMKKPIVLDGRNCFDINDFKHTNIIYDSIGRVVINGGKNEVL